MISFDLYLKLNNEEIDMIIREFIDVSNSIYIYIIKCDVFICNSLHMDYFL